MSRPVSVGTIVASITLSACPAFREEAVRPRLPSGLLEKLDGTTRRLDERMETSKEPGRVVQILLTSLVFKATRMRPWLAQQAFSIAAVYLSAVGW